MSVILEGDDAAVLRLDLSGIIEVKSIGLATFPFPSGV